MTLRKRTLHKRGKYGGVAVNSLVSQYLFSSFASKNSIVLFGDISFERKNNSRMAACFLVILFFGPYLP